MKKILIVEDDKKIAKALHVRFTAHGYAVATTFDAVMAATTARSYSPDLILLDIALPGGDGFVLAERFQDIQNTAGVPFVFITASKKQGLRERAMGVGASGFFEKPFDSGQLMGVVNQLI
ncbi:MAG: response regulator [Gammaproteobacteria bacterium]|nr:response regulator [Gammaproteobacteria bacterium]